MSFEVDPSALRTFSRHLDGCAVDASDGKSYMLTHGDFSFREEGAMIALLRTAHTTLIEELRTRLANLQDVLEQSGVELMNTAKYYEDTDQDSAARTDATYPAADRPTTVR